MSASTTIPIENLYWILAYAWKAFPEASTTGVGDEPADAPLEPFARALISGIRHAMRRGLTRAYRPEQDPTPVVRGALEIGLTIKSGALARRRLACSFDELTHDGPENRIIRAALRMISTDDALDHALRRDARFLWRRFEDVADIDVDARVLHSVRICSNDRHYAFLLDVARFVLTSTIPTTSESRRRFRDIDVPKQIGAVFERFVRAFFKRECPWLGAKAPHLSWADTVERSADAAGLLPRMETDVVLRHGGHATIIDSKFYAETLRAGRFGTERLREAHLYQLISYLENARRAGFADSLEGVLLYPFAQRDLDARWEIHGFPLRACTVNLGQPWSHIRQQLLALAPSPSARGAA